MFRRQPQIVWGHIATSEWFELTTDVKQGCTMSGFLFVFIIDWVMRHTVKEEGTGLRWKFTSKLR